MALLDFPNSPTPGQQYTAPSGAVYTWDGSAWTVSGVISTGSTAGGDLSGTYPNPTVVKASGGLTIPTTGNVSHLTFGALTAKGHLFSESGGSVDLTYNAALTGAGAGAWVQDDAAKPCWLLRLNSSDDIDVFRAPAGNPPAWGYMLGLDSTGKLSLPGSASVYSMEFGTQTIKGTILGGNSAGTWMGMNINSNPATGAVNDTTRPGWEVLVRSDSDQFEVRRRAPTTQTFNSVFSVNGDLKTYCSLGNGLVLRDMIAASHTAYTWNSAAFPASSTWSNTGGWVRIVDMGLSPRSNSLVIISVYPSWTYAGGTAGQAIYVGVGRQYGAPFLATKWDMGSGSGLYRIALPTFVYIDSPPAGTTVYSVWVYVVNNAGSLMMAGDNPGFMYAINLC